MLDIRTAEMLSYTQNITEFVFLFINWIVKCSRWMLWPPHHKVDWDINVARMHPSTVGGDKQFVQLITTQTVDVC